MHRHFQSFNFVQKKMYSWITENGRSITNLPETGNLIVFSKLKEIHANLTFRGFSIKYACEGEETYTINGTKFKVSAGQYLLANNFAEGNVQIESKNPVKGICIDFDTNLVAAAAASFSRPDTPIPDQSLDLFFTTPAFLENQYMAKNTKIGALLLELDKLISAAPFVQHQFTEELYLNLAERLVEDYKPIIPQLNAVPGMKLATKKDLFRRLILGKLFISEHFSKPLNIEDIAKEIGMSKFHFFRLFKQVFNQSPYQYLLQKRLEYAVALLKKGNASISEIAMDTGFSDIHAFSKAFKNTYGTSPSHFIK